MFLSGVKRREYILDKEKLIKNVNDMKDILNTYKKMKNEDNLNKYIISLNLIEYRIRDTLGSYYPISDGIGVPKYLEDALGKNKETVSVLKKWEEIFYNEFFDFLEVSSNFYRKAFENNFIDYPYNLINEEVKKIIIYSLTRGMFDY